MADLRLSSGLFFLLLGLILCATGVLAPEWKAPLAADYNVNLASGASMLVFGGALVALARRGR